MLSSYIIVVDACDIHRTSQSRYAPKPFRFPLHASTLHNTHLHTVYYTVVYFSLDKLTKQNVSNKQYRPVEESFSDVHRANCLVGVPKPVSPKQIFTDYEEETNTGEMMKASDERIDHLHLPVEVFSNAQSSLLDGNIQSGNRET